MIHGGNVWQGDRPGDWLDLSASVRPGGPPSWVREALLSAMERLEYYPQLSMARGRTALGAFLGLDPGHVLPTAGGISAIALAARLPCDRVRIPVPAFTEYAALSGQYGLTVETVPLLAPGRSVRPLTECLGEDLEENTCVWLCNPCNPVGVGFSPEEILDLLALVRQKNGWLAVDEAFIHYCPEYTVAPLTAAEDRLLVTGSMTKILGIPGVRLGYLCGKDLDSLQGYQNPWELSCFAEAVAMALPDHREDLREECSRSRERRESFRTGLEDLGIFVYPSDANFLLADFGRDVRPIEEFLYGKKILVRRCMDFEGINDGRHLRLAVKDENAVRRTLEALKEAMECAEKA
ncbi:MAG: aminotransferase class I/II-fold pyridoxal phosphate-dependent enzyme [Oscillospiraceae bacterium]|nr:aminotransferase class I/II-fold pyridoxal phosphate-dependent enzyme [Oscillospiraceae bacterium]